MEPVGSRDDDLGVLDRATRAVATKLVSRRSLLRGGTFGLVGLATGLKVLAPTDASACGGCNLCYSGGVNGCGHSLTCYSANSTQHTCDVDIGCWWWCATQQFSYYYIKNYICDEYCDAWCAYDNTGDQCTTK